MGFEMNTQTLASGKLLFAHITLKWLLSSVDSDMNIQIAALGKFLVAHSALKWLFSRMGS